MYTLARFAAIVCAVWACSSGTSCAQESSDLATMIKLLDSEKLAGLNEIKELRLKNSTNAQQAPLYDFGYGLMLVKFGRWQDAIDVLRPFADQRPQVFRAKLLLARAYIELGKFDDAIVQFDKLLDKLPTEKEVAEDVARTTGIFAAYLNLARADDCPEELRKKIQQAAESKLPEELKAKFIEGQRFVETEVARLNNEIARVSEKTEEETEEKIANDLENANKLKAEAESKESELLAREKERADKLVKLKTDLQKLELAAAANLERMALLDNQMRAMAVMQQNLVQDVIIEDSNGNRRQTQQIANPAEYNRLGRNINAGMVEQGNLSIQSRVLMGNYRQLQSQASGLMSQKELDEMFTKSKMSDLNRAAEAKQKRAEREEDRKTKKSAAAARGYLLKLKDYSTYDSLDIAPNKDYLASIAQRFLK